MQRLSRFSLVVVLATLSAAAHAVAVTSTATPVAGTAWTIALALDTSGATGGITGLGVHFDPSLFGSLSTAVVPAGWDPLLLQPDTGLPAAGVFDALALGSAPQPGQTPAGFSVDVTYLGSGAPGPLRYELYTLGTGGSVNVLYSGMTTPVPEPSTAWLLALGVTGFAFGAHRIAARRLA